MHPLSSGSYWFRHVPAQSVHGPLAHDIEVDVAIVGAGITGLTTAMHLKQAGVRVAVLEGGIVGGGTTGGSTGHLEIWPDQGMTQLVRDFGESTAGEVTQARQQAIDQIERWTREFEIECDFRRVPACLFAEHADRAPQIQREFAAGRNLNLPVLPKMDAELPFPTAAGMHIAHQARFDSLRYVQGLAKVVQGDQVTIYENTRAERPKDSKHCVIKANGWEVRAENLVLATHSAYLGISQFDVRQAPYLSYVMAVRVAEDVPDALFFDNEEPYHYLRWAKSDDPQLLIIGGADNKVGQGDPEERFRRLENYIRQRLAVHAIEERWSAELFEPADGLPFIGRAPGMHNVFVATGFSGTGLTFGTVAGKIISDMILGRIKEEVPYFNPSRITPLASATDFLTENINAAYHFVADRFSADTDSLEDIPSGQGRLVKCEGQNYAAYRDDSGELHVMAPKCTHAGCIVHWNQAEKTWDCPCHGGRFSATGERLYGPPAADLEPKQVPQHSQ